jgi:carbamoyltransferase
LYSAFTYYLGFMVNSAEYKVMGLAPYGKPRYADLIKEKLVDIHDDGSIHLDLSYFTFHYGMTMTGRRFEQLFGRERRSPESKLESFHEDVAASIQAVTEEIVIKMATHVREKTGLDKLCLSGGVALNCKANGLLLKKNVFSDIYVQPASGDAGGAVGAALYAHYRISGDDKKSQPFFGIGPDYGDADIKRFLDRNNVPYRTGDTEDLLTRLARRIAEGNIVAIFQGAMEFGPRALGFRSIVADPRDNAMKEKINAAVKYREPFRPFAPAVLIERVSDYFDCGGESPFMLFNFTVVEDKREVIPAVTHVDNSSRIQTVNSQDNPAFYSLIKAFEKITGLPVVLNTSFNLRGHPIVNTPEEAFATFCSGGIDFLLMGGFLIGKRELGKELIGNFALERKTD